VGTPHGKAISGVVNRRYTDFNHCFQEHQMNTKTQAEINATNDAAAEAKAAAPAAEEEDWLSGVTPQASCNLDGTCESCQ
jgi:hypothetical protein